MVRAAVASWIDVAKPEKFVVSGRITKQLQTLFGYWSRTMVPHPNATFDVFWFNLCQVQQYLA